MSENLLTRAIKTNEPENWRLFRNNKKILNKFIQKEKQLLKEKSYTKK